ncbi:MAG: hypothetical protein K2G21_02585 [Muribaculaceae bacterium]|nr:hypothetical protein [Muribaculaceae bacterium]
MQNRQFITKKGISNLNDACVVAYPADTRSHDYLISNAGCQVITMYIRPVGIDISAGVGLSWL